MWLPETPNATRALPLTGVISWSTEGRMCMPSENVRLPVTLEQLCLT